MPQYQWWAKGKPGQILGRGHTLILRPVRLTSAGTYHCQPYNSLGKGGVGTAHLSVVQEPRIIAGLPNQVIKIISDQRFHRPTQVVKSAGHVNLNLTCLGTGRPTPTVTWYRDGLELGSELGERYTVEGDDLGRTADLRIQSMLIFSGRGRDGGGLEPRDSGEYTCQYDNSVGRAQSAVAVKVEHKPFLSEMQRKVAADPGGMAQLACRVRSFPAPQFHWMRAGVSLNSASLGSRQVRQVSDYEYESVFTLQTVAQGTYGDYLCRASNSFGSCEIVVAVVPRGRPDTPGAPRTLEVGANRLLLTWQKKFDGGMNDTVYGLQWEEQGGLPGSGGSRECKETICGLEGLQQHTTYRLLIYSPTFFTCVTYSFTGYV